MGSFRTKEDDVAKIYTSVFVTNFPESISAKELFNACKQYGHVVDTFIPTKRSRAGKRFGFVRFINVFSMDRLVNNLCTVWIDRFKLHANVARFNRASVNSQKNDSQMDGDSKGYCNNRDKNGIGAKNYSQPHGSGRSFVHVVKGQVQSGIREVETCPALVLDEDCLTAIDVSKCLLGRVKEFASLANLKMALCNEGFSDITIKYMGEFWVMMEFVNEKSLKLFRDNASVNSWFSQVKIASLDFVTEGRIAWVEIEGLPFQVWSGNSFKRIAARWGELLDIDDLEETYFHSKRLCILTKNFRSISEDFKIIFRGKVFWIRAKETPGWVPEFMNDEEDDDQSVEVINEGDTNDQEDGYGINCDEEEVPETAFGDVEQELNKADVESVEKSVNMSEDPFNIYPLLNKRHDNDTNNNDSGGSLKYPPGFTPNVGSAACGSNKEDGININDDKVYEDNVEEEFHKFSGDDCSKHSKEGETDSVCSGHFKKSKGPRTGGSILNLLDEVVKVGQVMGYKMDGCMSNMVDIIESQGEVEGYR
ncbi:nucleotide-binding alpha-beta plait domain-containing protein [Tanacetum coccineum]